MVDLQRIEIRDPVPRMATTSPRERHRTCSALGMNKISGIQSRMTKTTLALTAIAVLAVGCGMETSRESADSLTEGTASTESALKALRLSTGLWAVDGATGGTTFQTFDVHVNMEFELSGCGFQRAAGTGESTFSANPNSGYTYLYQIDKSGCLTPPPAPPGQATAEKYTAPAVPGTYTISFFTWGTKRNPYEQVDRGTYSVNVLP